MKLCIVSRNLIKGDGQSRVNYEVASAAIRRGYQVTLLTSNIAPELQSNPLVKWINISVKGWPTQLLSSLIFSRRSTNWLRIHHLDFDVILVNGANTQAMGDVNAAHFVHYSWWRSPIHPWQLHHDLYGAYQWLYTALNTYWEKKAFCQAKIVVAVSEKIKQELIKIGVPKDRIKVILNGVDLKEFSVGYADRNQLGLPEQATLALFVGDIRTPRKNLDTVLYALSQVPDLHLAIVGNVERSPYPQLAANLGLKERVHFLGFRHDVSEIMKAVDLFVFPSRYEPFGMVVIEAMAAGLPVITTASSGVAEIITPNSGIVLSDSEDTQALAKALSWLANDPNLRKQMGQAARAIAEHQSWASKATSYLNLFEELISS